jgi:replicative DNA helicase Mcm
MAEQTSGRIEQELEAFLKSYQDEKGTYKYRERISQMPALGHRSLILEYDDLLTHDTDLAHELVNNPDRVLGILRRATYNILRDVNPSYAELIHRELEVRVRGLHDRLALREITSRHLDKLISAAGMVVRTSELKPMAIRAAYRCKKCGHLQLVEQKGPLLKPPDACESCNATKGFDLDPKESEFIDFQVIRIQELPEELPPGQLPQYFDVNLTGDLVNRARPGDRIVFTGIVRAEAEYTQRGRLRLFHSRIDGNYIEVLGKEPEQIEITEEDEALIKEIAAQPDAYERLIASIAPAIHGLELQKEAILLTITGAPQIALPDGTTLRGDINILLVGDPGTGKSELLKFTSNLAPRGLYTSGRGSTAAGLTAAVVRERTGMMMLEAGAVVLADQGVACIDEFDKMRTEDRNALHEVMEQQQVSVAKGGIVATLNARTSIVAAANPVLGKYDVYRNIAENVNLPIPLLTRFDLIFVMRDVPDRTRDEMLANHVLEIHRKRDYAEAPPIGYDLLRKYIYYAKRIEPVLTEKAAARLKEYYLQMRSSITDDKMITVTPRQLEALIRLATARARVLLHREVTEEDADRAIALMRRMLETVGVDVKTGRVDLGVLHGKPLSERNLLEVALDVFKLLEGPQRNPVEGRRYIEELVKTGRFTEEEAKKMLNTLNRSGQIYEVKPGYYRKL